MTAIYVIHRYIRYSKKKGVRQKSGTVHCALRVCTGDDAKKWKWKFRVRPTKTNNKMGLAETNRKSSELAPLCAADHGCAVQLLASWLYCALALVLALALKAHGMSASHD